MSRTFATTSDHLDNTSGAPATAPPMTVSAWVKLSALGSAVVVVTFGTSGSASQRFSLLITAGNAPAWTEFDTATSQAVATATIADNNWHLITGISYDHTNRAAYLDGGNKGTIAALKAANAATVTRLSTTPSGTFPVVGQIAQVAAWNIALQDSDVASLATYYPNLVQPGALLAYWPMTGASPEPDEDTGAWPLTVTGTTYTADQPTLSGLPSSSLIVTPNGSLAGGDVRAMWDERYEGTAPEPTIEVPFGRPPRPQPVVPSPYMTSRPTQTPQQSRQVKSRPIERGRIIASDHDAHAIFMMRHMG